MALESLRNTVLPKNRGWVFPHDLTPDSPLSRAWAPAGLSSVIDQRSRLWPHEVIRMETSSVSGNRWTHSCQLISVPKTHWLISVGVSHTVAGREHLLSSLARVTQILTHMGPSDHWALTQLPKALRGQQQMVFTKAGAGAGAQCRVR